MSDRAGYSGDFMESLGKCRACGGSKDYPMLVTRFREKILCRAEYHSLRYRLASWLFVKITGHEPKQPGSGW